MPQVVEGFVASAGLLAACARTSLSDSPEALSRECPYRPVAVRETAILNRAHIAWHRFQVRLQLRIEVHLRAVLVLRIAVAADSQLLAFKIYVWPAQRAMPLALALRSRPATECNRRTATSSS